MVLEPLGLPMDDDKTFLGLDQSSGREILGRFQLGDLNEAIRIVSTKFATEVIVFTSTPLAYLNLIIFLHVDNSGLSLQCLPEFLRRPSRGDGCSSESIPAVPARTRVI